MSDIRNDGPAEHDDAEDGAPPDRLEEHPTPEYPDAQDGAPAESEDGARAEPEDGDPAEPDDDDEGAPAEEPPNRSLAKRLLIAGTNVIVLALVVLLLVLGVPPLTHYFDQDTTKNSCVPPGSTASSSTQKARAAAAVTLRRAEDRVQAARLSLARAAGSAQTVAARQALIRARDDAKAARARVATLTRVGVKVPSSAPTHFDLGDALDGGQRSIEVNLDRPIRGGRPLAVAPTRFVSDDEGRDLVSGDITAWSYPGPGSTTATVVFCIQPNIRKDLPSGTFSGGLTLSDPRVKTTEIPISFSLKYTNREAVYVFALAVCALASLYVYFLRRPQLGRKKTPDEPTDDTPVLRWGFDFVFGYWKFVTGSLGILTIAAGFTAATAALSAQYLDSETWDGSNFKDWLTLGGALATAFVAGGTAGRLAQNVYARPTDGSEPEPRRGRRAGRHPQDPSSARHPQSPGGQHAPRGHGEPV